MTCLRNIRASTRCWGIHWKSYRKPTLSRRWGREIPIRVKVLLHGKPLPEARYRSFCGITLAEGFDDQYERGPTSMAGRSSPQRRELLLGRRASSDRGKRERLRFNVICRHAGRFRPGCPPLLRRVSGIAFLLLNLKSTQSWAVPILRPARSKADWPQKSAKE